MSYPRIYSLSTVGIIKHYIHDYLFHNKRTDFIGDNGAGKSIIADLLQMMFIYDKSIIKFGTDGVKKEERSITTLPYKSQFAYCFLNIETSPNQYITIGIQINQTSRRSIIPFVLTNEADLDLPLEQLTFKSEEILFARNFIDTKGHLKDIQELANYLSEHYSIKLNSFSTSNDIKDYYAFLYNKNILPIDLTLEKNLKAFAKIIQSFSKAKALNLDGNKASQSLKDFLFEDSDEDILENFNKEKTTLEEILRDYKRLNEHIQVLKQKQETLLYLRELELTYQRFFKEYKLAELSSLQQTLQELKEKEIGYQQLLGNNKSELEKTQTLIAKTPRIKERIKNEFDTADKSLSSIHQYESLIKELESLIKELTELKMLIIPDISDEWRTDITHIDFSIRTTKDFKNYIEFSQVYLSKYESIAALKKKRIEEIDKITELKQFLKSEEANKQAIIKLLNGKDNNSVLGWYINTLPKIDDAQLQAILHFATLNIAVLNNAENGSRIIEPDQLLSEFKSTATENGIWVKLGALSEFIKSNPEAKMLDNAFDKESTINSFLEKQETELKAITHKLSELQNVLDGKPYNESLFDIVCDTLIIDKNNIDDLLTAISCLCKIEEKTALLEQQITEKENQKKELRQSFGVRYDEPEVVKKELEARKQVWRKRENWINKFFGEKSNDLKSLQSKQDGIWNDLTSTTANITREQNHFDKLNTEYYNLFKENVDTFIDHPQVEEIQKKYEDAWEKYKSTYNSSVNLQEETKNHKNVGVNLEVNNQKYSFSVLEQAWLGTRIKSTDDITAALDEANQNRTTIADGIRDSMLKVFGQTVKRYNGYKDQIQKINLFFVNKKISNRFNFKLDFSANKQINIEYINALSYKIRDVAKSGELQFGGSIDDFVVDFFLKQAKINDTVPVNKLLNPKTFFELSAQLTDQLGVQAPGSTGETYSSIALLGIARLSIMQKEQRKGLRFMILEELGSLDATNFKTFPAIADEFNYQIITMAPHVFNIGFSDEWYAHHLIKGNVDDNINYVPSASFFQTKNSNEDLDIYLKGINNELD